MISYCTCEKGGGRRRGGNQDAGVRNLRHLDKKRKQNIGNERRNLKRVQEQWDEKHHENDNSLNGMKSCNNKSRDLKENISPIFLILTSSCTKYISINEKEKMREMAVGAAGATWPWE